MKSIRKVIIIGNVIIILLLASSSIIVHRLNSENENKIKGRIFDFETNKPLSNCAIILEYLDENYTIVETVTTNTNNNGHFWFDYIKEPEDFNEKLYVIRLQAYSDFHVRGREFLEFDGEYEEVNMHLYSLGKLSGRIINFHESDHEMYVFGYPSERRNDIFPMKLDDKGELNGNSLLPGFYDIVINSNYGLSKHPITVEVIRGETINVDLIYDPIISNITLHLNITYYIDDFFTGDPYLVISNTDHNYVSCFYMVNNNYSIALPKIGRQEIYVRGLGNSERRIPFGYFNHQEIIVKEGDNYLIFQSIGPQK